MAYNPSSQINMADNDEIVANERTRASYTAKTVGTVTFPGSPLGTAWINGTGTPISTVPGASSTIDVGQLLTGVIVQAPSAANTSTLDTAANIVAGVNKIMPSGAVVGDYISCLMFNGSAANTITIAAGSGGGFDSNNSGRIIPIASATSNASKQVLIRLTNVTPGSEAYVIYL